MLKLSSGLRSTISNDPVYVLLHDALDKYDDLHNNLKETTQKKTSAICEVGTSATAF